MSLYNPDLEAVATPFPGIEVLELGGQLTAGEFTEAAAGLVVPVHYSGTGELIDQRLAGLIGDTASMSRSPSMPRDPWSPDHHWHSDRTYWGENHFATVLYASRLAGPVAATELIDTTLLLEEIEADNPGITEELADTEIEISMTKYYKEVLFRVGSPEAIARTKRQFGASTLRDIVDMTDYQYPAKHFPAIVNHPFRNQPSSMIDGVRTVKISKLKAARSLAIIKMFENDYLNLPAEALAERPYYRAHQWEEGQVLIFPQRGSLHRAMPSPHGELRRDMNRLFIT